MCNFYDCPSVCHFRFRAYRRPPVSNVLVHILERQSPLSWSIGLGRRPKRNWRQGVSKTGGSKALYPAACTFKSAWAGEEWLTAGQHREG